MGKTLRGRLRACFLTRLRVPCVVVMVTLHGPRCMAASFILFENASPLNLAMDRLAGTVTLYRCRWKNSGTVSELRRKYRVAGVLLCVSSVARVVLIGLLLVRTLTARLAMLLSLSYVLRNLAMWPRESKFTAVLNALHKHNRPWRLSAARRCMTSWTLVPLLTFMEVANFREVAPTLTSGTCAAPSCSTLVGATVNDEMTIVLVPLCIGSLLKNLLCVFVLLTGRTIRLQLVDCSILPRFLTTCEAN